MQLPSPLDRLLPDLSTLVPADEPLAPCARCVMATPAAPDRPAFTAPARCCTHHPDLPNFLVGAALRAGGIGAERVRLRLEDPSGVTPAGIAPSDAYCAHRTPGHTGTDPRRTCPYWVEGPLSCSIHAHRDAICRTWFCRLAHGRRSHEAWMAARDLVREAERQVAQAVEHEPDGDWVAYFLRCADRAAQLSTLDGPRLERRLKTLQAAATWRDQPLPDRPVPWIGTATMRETHVELESFSDYDPVFMPVWIFELLSRLDGERHWTEALEQTRAVVGEHVSPDLVLRLWERGLLAPPSVLEADGVLLAIEPLAPTDLPP